MARISIYSPPEPEERAVNGKVQIYCDCEFGDRCLNGKPPMSDRCLIWISVAKLARAERIRLIKSRR
jgi:hypothetical protein